MTPLLEAFLAGALAVLAVITVLWLLSARLRDVSIVDIFWGLGFVLVAWVYRSVGPPAELRQMVALALVSIWGLRLALFIGWRNHGKGEDYRYQAMRKAAGPSFWWTSYFRVFVLQGVLLCLIATPHLWIQVATPQPAWRWSDTLGVALWCIGFFFEAVGDWQMARFKADPANRGQVLNTGLWAWTRHPNYFGDATVWWGFFCLALATPGGYWTLPSVVLMTFLLLKVSGVALLEKTIADRRPGYREYIENTSAFFPRPPKRRDGRGEI